VFVTERDLFLAHSLQVAADSIPMHAMPGRVGEGADPVVVVGVVGIGHVPGILSNWGKVTKDDIRWGNSRLADPDPHSIFWRALHTDSTF
jgi:pheromone shutdown protein TraB